MTYLGRIQNGVVVFDGMSPLADGTRVRVEPDPPTSTTHGTPGEEFLQFRGLIDRESLRQMTEAIEDCGKVDPDGW